MDLPGDISGVLFIEYISDGEQHVVGLPQTVDVVGDGDKADAFFREIAFQKAAALDIIPPEAG